MICFEVYMLSVVWRAFVYICDFNMQRQIEKIVQKKLVVIELKKILNQYQHKIQTFFAGVD